MSKRRKQQIRNMLVQRNIDAVKSLGRDSNSALRLLFAETYDLDELIQWRAIEALGIAAEVQAKSRLSKIRDFVRRLFWLMNDESGGLGWRAPEAIGEILARIPDLAAEQAVLLPHFFVEEPFERGTFFAVSRIAEQAPHLFFDHAELLSQALTHEDPGIRAFALRTLIAMDRIHPHRASSLLEDDAPVQTYDFSTGVLTEISPASVARTVCS